MADRRILYAAPLLLLAACGQAPEAAPAEVETAIPVEPDGGIGDGAPPPDGTARQPDDSDTLAATMPQTLRGQWREDDLGRAPRAEDCNQTSQSNRNFGKVLTVRADGYSLFESGGRIMTVHQRTDTMVDATFDTTYADTPTSARQDFAIQADGTLAVNDDDGDGTPSVTQYRPCPEQGE